LALLGCIDRAPRADDEPPPDAALEAGTQTQGARVFDSFRTPPRVKVDMLFVVDDSGSMCEEQGNLARNFRALADGPIRQIPNADWRFAVVSTDMHPPNGRNGRFLTSPAPPVPSLNCRDEAGEALAPDTADCAELVESGALSPILRWGPGAEVAQEAELARRFRCMVTLGTNGDGFEKGLEAMRTALSCDGPNVAAFGACCVDGVYDQDCVAEPRFLRPDALLVVVFVSDENDCSDPAANPARSRRPICRYGPADEDGDGVPDAYLDRALCGELSPADCFLRDCGELDPAACRRSCAVDRAEGSECEWRRSELVPVADYVDFLSELKDPRSGKLLVVAIVGLRDYTEAGFEISYNPGAPEPVCDPESERYDPEETRDRCCPDGRCRGPVQPSCESANGAAFSGRRYLELAEAFGGVGCPVGAEGDTEPCTHICVDDHAEAYGHIKERIVTPVPGYCLSQAPHPVEPDFAVTVDGDRVPSEAFEVISGAGCPGDLVIRLRDVPPPESLVIIEYRSAGANAR